MTPTQWYVVHTKPHQEPHVLDRLRFRAPGVETFYAQMEVVQRRARRRVAVLEPLFPSYLFVRTSPDLVPWGMIIWTPGVRGVLGDGCEPLPVPEGLIRSIQDRIVSLGFVRVGPQFQLGAPVRVREGPFAGLEGIFERPVSREGRVRVLLAMLERCVSVELDALDLERV